MSKTIIASSGKVRQPGKNQEYVNSRASGRKEQIMKKMASAKHKNLEYFKKQSDRKNSSY